MSNLGRQDTCGTCTMLVHTERECDKKRVNRMNCAIVTLPEGAEVERSIYYSPGAY